MRRSFHKLVRADDGVDNEWVTSLGAAIERVQVDRFDVILLDLGVPDSNSLATYATLHRHLEGVPVLVLSKDTVLAEQVVLCGAQDYVGKSELTRELLLLRIRYSIDRQKMLDAYGRLPGM